VWQRGSLGVVVVTVLSLGTVGGAAHAVNRPPAAHRASEDSLSAVACRHLSNCWAVGFRGHDPSHGGTLAERWSTHHHDWRHVSTPNPSGMAETNFQGIGCAGTSNCVAVGAGETASLVRSAVAEHWNGHHWSLTSLPLTARQPDSILWAASCANRHFCFAVGSYTTDAPEDDTAALIFQWDGSAWSLVGAPDEGNSSELFGVSCTSATSCLAVGDYTKSFIGHPLTERWNGVSWSIVTPTNHVHSQSVQLASVACSARTACLAVGNYFTFTTSLERTFDEQWNGTASVGKPKNPSPPHTSQLIGVACTSTTYCVAVGNEPITASHVKTLAERWNGSTWHILGTPAVGSSHSLTLLAISCVSASDCFAVGDNAGAAPHVKALAERWNGHHWHVVHTQDP
jgi:hypothetical protein